MEAIKKDPILSARDVEIQFSLRGDKLTAIRGCSLDLYDGETLAIVGESGSGKSVFTKSFLGMLDQNGSVTGGSIMYHGNDLAKYTTEKEWRTIRGKKIAMVMQDPMTSLNPLKKVGLQIQEAIELHQGLGKAEAKQEAIRMLDVVGIPNPQVRYNQYPHEFSGGMRQRAVIAIAVACHPEILICDEPTTALDVTIQAQILDLIRKLQKNLGMTIIYITHDLGVVANVADRVAVMYAGQIVEIGTCDEVFYDPRHPYSWALLSALPQLGIKGEKLPTIDGTPPNLFNKIVGDAFAPRNRKALAIDFKKEPPFFDVSPTHKAKTWYLDPRAPKVEQPESIQRLSQRMNVDYGSSLVHPHQDPNREAVIEVKDLQVTFGTGRKKFVAVDHVNFEIYRGETFALVGESGSGKTTIGRAITRINPTTAGDIFYKGRKINGKISKQLDLEVIKGCQMIFQDPLASLNERAKVDYIVSEGIINHHLYKDEADREEKVQKALNEVGLLPEFASRFPHEFSGGQRQRIGIARALIMQPEFIVADEPISALDVSIRAQVLNLLNDLKKSRGLTYLFIAHDLSVVRFISDRIAVIHKGRIVELAEAEELFRHPLHPYTKSLLSAVPNPDPAIEKHKKLIVYDPGMHDYSVDKPEWCELLPEHFVYGNAKELDGYRKELELN
ncbi:MAG: dipeptide ABC transporter ATP-binding protein [Christensenellales bacterium]|jgi:peptide/nickel transport system ATP-binding protein